MQIFQQARPNSLHPLFNCMVKYYFSVYVLLILAVDINYVLNRVNIKMLIPYYGFCVGRLG